MSWSPRTASLALLVALLAVAVVGTGFVAGQAADGPNEDRRPFLAQEESPNYLSPSSEAVTRQEHGTATVDVGTAVTVDSQRLHARHDALTFDERFRAADTEDEKLSVAGETATRINANIETLDRRQARLFRMYSSGNISTSELLGRNARLGAATERQRQRIEHTRRTATATPGVSLPFSLEVRFDSLASEIVLIPNPVGEPVDRAITGTAPPQTVYVRSADDALVLATVNDDGTYLREATLRGERDRGGPDQFQDAEEAAILAAFQRGAELYPWVFENAIGDPSIRSFGDSSVYLVEADHPQGTFSTYLDGATTNAFREHHRNQPNAVPVTGTVASAGSGLEVSVETTAPTGPMRVSTTDADTGDPVAAEVTVDGHAVGSTGSEGQLWTVQPAEPFEVTATTPGNESVTVAGS